MREPDKIENKIPSLFVILLFLLVVGYSMFFGLRQIILYLIFLPVSFLAIKYSKLTPPKGRSVKLAMALCLVSILYAIFEYYYLFVRDVSIDPNSYRAISTSSIELGLILAPIIEELAFRRVLLTALLKSNLHWFLACCISTILFILAHSPNKWIYVAIPGILFSLIYYFSGSLRLSIFIHFINNGIFYIDPTSFGAVRVWCDPCVRF